MMLNVFVLSYIFTNLLLNIFIISYSYIYTHTVYIIFIYLAYLFFLGIGGKEWVAEVDEFDS